MSAIAGERFFLATAMAGRLYVNGIGGRNWDPQRLCFHDGAAVDLIVQARMIDRIVRSFDELSSALEESRVRGLPTITIWIREDLVGLAQKLWEHSQAGDLGRNAFEEKPR